MKSVSSFSSRDACYAVKINKKQTKQIFQMGWHTPGAPVLDPPLKRGGSFI